MLKLYGNLAKWIFVICLPVLLIASGIAWGFNSLWIYKYGFTKYNVSQASGLSPAELDKAARGMIAYFNSKDEYVHITLIKDGAPFELFTEEEQIHLKDVKQLVWLDYKIFFITLALVLAYSLVSLFWRQGRYRKQLARSILWGSGITISILALMGIGALFDFDQLFLQFHYLAFTNQYWSAQGYMILLFGGLWYDAALFFIGFVAACALVLGSLSVLYLKRKRLPANNSESQFAS
jgi:integral membrane protein (TIGR01906 family)